MSKKFNKARKPQTAYAKADAKVTAEHRKVYPGWDDDAVRFGIRVADYNAGWIAGDDNRREKSSKELRKRSKRDKAN